MDIEGAEINALIGAYSLIQKNRPTLAICVYHKQEHLYQIPFLMKAITSDYRFYLRHYRKYAVSETVCYGVPREKSLR